MGALLLTSGSLESLGEAQIIRVMVSPVYFTRQENCQCGSDLMTISMDKDMEQAPLWISGTIPMEDL